MRAQLTKWQLLCLSPTPQPLPQWQSMMWIMMQTTVTWPGALVDTYLSVDGALGCAALERELPLGQPSTQHPHNIAAGQQAAPGEQSWRTTKHNLPVKAEVYVGCRAGITAYTQRGSSYTIASKPIGACSSHPYNKLLKLGMCRYSRKGYA